MKNFFNGVTNAEVAALNTASADLGFLVQQLLATEEHVATCSEILNNEDLPPFDREIELVFWALEQEPALQQYSKQDVRDKVSRRINTNSRQIAKKLGHSQYLVYSRGKVNDATLALESKQ